MWPKPYAVLMESLEHAGSKRIREKEDLSGFEGRFGVRVPDLRRRVGVPDINHYKLSAILITHMHRKKKQLISRDPKP